MAGPCFQCFLWVSLPGDWGSCLGSNTAGLTLGHICPKNILAELTVSMCLSCLWSLCHISDGVGPGIYFKILVVPTERDEFQRSGCPMAKHVGLGFDWPSPNPNCFTAPWKSLGSQEMQPGKKIRSEAKENKSLIIIIRLFYGIRRNNQELSSVFLFRYFLTEETSAEFSVKYKACLGDSYLPLMCFYVCVIDIYTSLNFLTGVLAQFREKFSWPHSTYI